MTLIFEMRMDRTYTQERTPTLSSFIESSLLVGLVDVVRLVDESKEGLTDTDGWSNAGPRYSEQGSRALVIEWGVRMPGMIFRIREG